jgi:glyoxylase-like metal-dependent hydrolase (beta-lactamase superfamily II)
MRGNIMLRLSVAVAVTCLVFLPAPVAIRAREPANKETKVPRWDAGGVGPLAWQGVACLDINDEDTRIVLGTIAPTGDPNILLLDGNGTLLRQERAGERWINQVALSTDQVVRAVCTMPAGRSGDMPEVFRLGANGVIAEAIAWRRGQYADGYFHYGDHTNHVTRLLAPSRPAAVVVNGDQVHWLGAAGKTVYFPLQPTAIPVAIAVDPTGVVVVGITATPSKKDSLPPNLHILDPSRPKPLWSRPLNIETAEAPQPEKGRYGTPTLPDGRREELPQRDENVWAPLAVAVHAEGMADAGEVKRLFAAADYKGWQRWVRSAATNQDENLGVRFMPARPAVTIYDQNGEPIRRFDPNLFAHPFWCDLRFLSDGKRLLAWPHSWTSRGLAGHALLPVDDDAADLYVLEISSGKVARLTFPDAISDAAVSKKGVVAGCWDGHVYLLGEDDLTAGRLPAGIAVGGPSLVRVTNDGSRVVVATTGGVVRLLDAAGNESWQTDLNQTVKHVVKPWVESAHATPIAKGVWQLPGGRVESDLGGQVLIEAPHGLILIEAHSALSFEAEWAAIKAVGLDPARVKYVLATHEHGDHAPGAYLWRVVTGAKFVCSEEMAYNLQHHVPINSGYGFHPPVPADIIVTKDTDLDLAGQNVRAVRIPGHTYGSMAWQFDKAGKSYVAFGDLIMPRGVLGYSGSINFSARDVLASLRKLWALNPDVVLPGHGTIGGPADTLDAGIEVARAGGWGLIPPEKPDPYFRIAQKNVIVAAWNMGAVSAGFGDIDGDGRPDIAIVCRQGEGALVKVFLNKGGKFDDKPDHEIPLPQLAEPSKIRVLPAKGGVADIFVGGQSAALLVAEGKFPKYKVVRLNIADGHQVRVLDEGTRKQTVIAGRFSGVYALDTATVKSEVSRFEPEVAGPYVDVRMLDVNGDGRPDLVTSYGAVYLRTADGKLPMAPTLRLPTEKDEWYFLAVGDFNGDKRPDLVLVSYGMHGQTSAHVFYNTGDAYKPFGDKADAVIPLNPKQRGDPLTLVRDTPVVCDWNGDGFDHLVIGRGQSQEVLVLLGGRVGLDTKRSEIIELDYRVHYETGLFVGDFNGDGRLDLAVFGYTLTGVGWNGPPAAYIWLQRPREKSRK